jgi:CBS domain containing-hemolysin-like protein
VGSKPEKRRQIRWAVVITVWTFALAVILGLITQYLYLYIESMPVALLIILAIIFVGIFFDMIGTAAAAASEAPLLAKASKKVFGAREALYLVRNADRLANFSNDVVGDISGIISGGLAALLVLRLITAGLVRDNPLTSIIVTGIVSALTVGGKALGKTLAIKKSEDIILAFAAFLTKINSLLPGKIFFRHELPPRRK